MNSFLIYGFRIPGDLDQEEVLITKTAKETDFGVIENFIETLNLASRYKELEQCRTDVIKKMLLVRSAPRCHLRTYILIDIIGWYYGRAIFFFGGGGVKMVREEVKGFNPQS